VCQYYTAACCAFKGCVVQVLGLWPSGPREEGLSSENCVGKRAIAPEVGRSPGENYRRI
jgi:hypothetical protein